MSTDSLCARSLLFVPGNRPDRFEKALRSGADSVCIDLEDAVTFDQKEYARNETTRYLQDANDATRNKLAVRINRGVHGVADLAALRNTRLSISRLLVPKVKSGSDVVELQEELRGYGARIVALIESAEGISNAASIVSAIGEDGELMLGGADLAAELGARFSWEALLYARSAIIMAAGLTSIRVWDVPSLEIQNMHEVAEEARRVRDLGFDGKAAIHPRQISAIHTAFTPSEAEIHQARAVVAAAEQSRGNATTVDGRLVDGPVIIAARRVLAAAQSEKLAEVSGT